MSTQQDTLVILRRCMQDRDHRGAAVLAVKRAAAEGLDPSPDPAWLAAWLGYRESVAAWRAQHEAAARQRQERDVAAVIDLLAGAAGVRDARSSGHPSSLTDAA